MPDRAPVIAQLEHIGDLGSTRAGRVLDAIRLDIDGKESLMRRRRRNEEVLALAYQDGTMQGGDADVGNLREYAKNLPYRYVRWFESQMTSKKLVVKVNRDAGAGQRPGGPADNATGMWTGITLQRAAYEGGFKREMRAVVAEAFPRGTSVLRIGYHEQAITAQDAQEVGKSPQSVMVDAMQGDVEAKDGQDHAAIARGLGAIAEDPEFQLQADRDQFGALVERKAAHELADIEQERNEMPISSTRPTQRKVWMRKRRVGEDVGWAPWVTDVEDTPFWWERYLWTLAEVKASPLFTDAFKEVAQGFDARNRSLVMRGGETPSTQNMGSEAREAQSADMLEDDEKLVEWFMVWYRRPEMRSGGVVKMVSAEMPGEFIGTDDRNPHVDREGNGLIPNFYPFYDFTPILSSLTTPERTCGIPPMAVGMPQFERMAEYGRLRHESAMRHSLRLYQIHPQLKDKARVLDALQKGEDGFAFIAEGGLVDTGGKMQPAILPIQFTGNTQEIARESMLEEGDWVKLQAMPPAILQGVGLAKTATQEMQGIAAGERESGAIVTYFEERMADVLSGLRGLIRGNYDDETFIALLGEEGAAVMKTWQAGTRDDGDIIEVTAGANAQAQAVLERQQLMQAIALEMQITEPVTQLQKYDPSDLIEELHRNLDVGPPKVDDTPLRQLQMMVLKYEAELKQAMEALGAAETGRGSSPGGNGSIQGGPTPSEGEGPTEGNLLAGATRGTNPPVLEGTT